MAQHLSLNLSAGYRFGDQNTNQDDYASDASPKGAAGILYALHIKEHLLLNGLEPDSGIGVWGDYDLSRLISIDGAIFYLPRNDKQINYQDGGQALELYAGVRSGFRTGHFGYFAKVRPGMIQFAHTVNALQETSTYIAYTGKMANFALDTGGILETYLPHNLVLRAEGGNDLIFYHSKDVPINGEPLHVPGERRASVLILFGIGLLF